MTRQDTFPALSGVSQSSVAGNHTSHQEHLSQNKSHTLLIENDDFPKPPGSQPVGGQREKKGPQVPWRDFPGGRSWLVWIAKGISQAHPMQISSKVKPPVFVVSRDIKTAA